MIDAFIKFQLKINELDFIRLTTYCQAPDPGHDQPSP